MLTFLTKIICGRSYDASCIDSHSKKHPVFLTTKNYFGEMLQTSFNRSLWLLREFKPNIFFIKFKPHVCQRFDDLTRQTSEKTGDVRVVRWVFSRRSLTKSKRKYFTNSSSNNNLINIFLKKAYYVTWKEWILWN